MPMGVIINIISCCIWHMQVNRGTKIPSSSLPHCNPALNTNYPKTLTNRVPKPFKNRDKKRALQRDPKTTKNTHNRVPGRPPNPPQRAQNHKTYPQQGPRETLGGVQDAQWSGTCAQWSGTSARRSGTCAPGSLQNAILTHFWIHFGDLLSRFGSNFRF